jgi:hypothetical protein
MSTGNVESWAGNIADIGAAYPFVGYETPLVITGVVFWLWWHVRQIRTENRELREEVEKFGNAGTMHKVLDNWIPEKR